VVPDAATRERWSDSGQAQVVLLRRSPTCRRCRGHDREFVLRADSDRAVFFAIDTIDKQQPLLQNPQVRQALNYAINRDAIVRARCSARPDVTRGGRRPMAAVHLRLLPGANPYK